MSKPDRLQTLLSRFTALGVDALLVSDPTDVRYLANYPIEDTWLLLTAAGAVCITDGRYIEEVKKFLPRFRPVEFRRSMVEGVALCCRERGVARLGVDERHITAAQHRKLRSLCGRKVQLKAVNGAVDAGRAIKDSGELALIRKALALNLQAYQFIEPFLKPGARELDILHRLQDFIRKHDTAFAFDPIIASGPNSAYPHARVTSRKFCRNDIILIDLGMVYKGYNSDLTRMFFLGKMPASCRDAVKVVHDAQQEAFKVIRSGVDARDVFAAAWKHLKKHGLEKRFTHSLGHGIGLKVHEAPRLSHIGHDILEEHMVCTVEPGVYFPGEYGIRLEEMVVVTKKGCEVISANYDQ